MSNEAPTASKLGKSALFGVPSVKRLLHVKFPIENTKGPKYNSCSIVLLIVSVPGKGLLYR